MGIEGGAGGVNPNPSELTFQVTEGENKIDSVKQVGEATTDTDTGITSLSYEVKMTTDDGRERSFKVTVGYDENQLGDLAETIGKVVENMGADDIIATSGKRISTRLDGSGQTSVTSLKSTGGPPQTLDQLQTTNSKLAGSIGRVINCFHTSGIIRRETDSVSEKEIGKTSDPRREALELLDEIEREYEEGNIPVSQDTNQPGKEIDEDADFYSGLEDFLDGKRDDVPSTPHQNVNEPEGKEPNPSSKRFPMLNQGEDELDKLLDSFDFPPKYDPNIHSITFSIESQDS